MLQRRATERAALMDFLEGDELKTVGEVAKHFRVDDTTVRRWIKSGILKAVRLPQRGTRESFRIKVSTIRKFDENYQG